MNINFTPARTQAEATHYFHLRDSVVFPIAEYITRYPSHDAVLPMVLSVQTVSEPPATPKREATYYEGVQMMYDANAYHLRGLASNNQKINAIKGLRDFAVASGFSYLGLKNAKEAVESWMNDNGY